MTKQQDIIWACICKIDAAFSRDDVQSIPRPDLERLIVAVYDKLQEAI